MNGRRTLTALPHAAIPQAGASRLLVPWQFEARLHRTLERHHACLLQVDIDRFDALSDRLGAVIGERVIQTVAHLVVEALPESIVARRGHHSFLVLLEHTRCAEAHGIAQQLCETVAAANVSWQRSLRATISIGTLEIEPRMLGAGEALCAVDIACREARERGGNTVHACRWNDADVQRETREVGELPRLQRALDARRFVLYVQPIESLGATGQRCAEVLVRMVDEQGALHGPAAFVPAAERFGLMPQIDRCVLEQALAWLRGEPAIAAQLGYLAVNLSAQTLSSGETRETIEDLVRAQEQDAHRLCFEITESSLIRDVDAVRGFLERLAALGCRIALDDFGTGFCSLGYLQSLPVDLVKIDGAFVRACDRDAKTRTLLAAINDLCHRLGKQTVAEYADRASVLDVLRELGVDHAQGFAVSPPFALAELGERALAA